MILAILQARSSSSRLPCKVLKDLHGKPMILRQIERINKSRLIDQLVVATSIDPSDDELVRILSERGVVVRRGPLNDVLERFVDVSNEFQPETIVRLTADCPLTDSKIIDQVIASHLQNGCDYTSNVINPTFPDGLDVECITAEALKRLWALQLSALEREHVTLGIYSRAQDYSLFSVTQEPDLSDYRWTVDVQGDLDFVRKVYFYLHSDGEYFGQNEILELLNNHPEISRTNQDLGRNTGMNK